ncbi:MAG: CBS domain-containing protein [Victivallales bacterium]|nr:CBS domain-containing protein [Victivallales bacterium]
MTSALELESKMVGDLAVPLVEVKSLPLTASVADVERLSADTGFTRFPVYDGRIDNIIGVISVRHCIFAPGMEGSDTRHTPIAPLVDRSVLFVPENKTFGALLDELPQTSSSPMAIVVDEYGGMVGLVTAEDLVGRLLGGIQDLRNQHAVAILQAGEGIYECDGKANIHDLEQTIGIPLPPDPEFETAAGLALTLFGRVPRPGASLHYRGWRIKVLEMANHRIARLRFTRTP